MACEYNVSQEKKSTAEDAEAVSKVCGGLVDW